MMILLQDEQGWWEDHSSSPAREREFDMGCTRSSEIIDFTSWFDFQIIVEPLLLIEIVTELYHQIITFTSLGYWLIILNWPIAFLHE